MTTNDLLSFRDNKDSDRLYLLNKEIIKLKNEVTTLQDQTQCMQRSVANLRKNVCASRTEKPQNKDRSFWIHW